MASLSVLSPVRCLHRIWRGAFQEAYRAAGLSLQPVPKHDFLILKSLEEVAAPRLAAAFERCQLGRGPVLSRCPEYQLANDLRRGFHHRWLKVTFPMPEVEQLRQMLA